MRHANVAFFIPHIGCPHRCSFCDQHAISGAAKAPKPEEVRQVCEQALSDLGGRAQNSEIAFFGGSFTAIDRGYMTALLEAAAPFVGKDGFSGIRVSTRPDAVEAEILSILKGYGVTAIELGAQSMDDGVLSKNQRGHTAADVAAGAGRIREMGFSLGLQMMVGLYGDTLSGAEETAEKLAVLHPDTVRIYPTVILRGTQLAQLWDEGRYRLPDFDETVKLCARLLLFFEGQGIRVIRLGLHASQEMENHMVAGLYHPAFRELCENEIYLAHALEQIKAQRLPYGKLILWVAPGHTSKMAGQKRRNLEILTGLGYQTKIKECPGLLEYEVKAEGK